MNPKAKALTDEYICPRYPTFTHSPADLRLVSVHTRRIYVPVAMFESSEYGRKAIIVLIDTKPQEGHRVT